MKKIILLFTVCISSAVSAQNITIPDANFKNALVNTQCADTNSDGFIDNDADTNNDGEIQLSEALAINYLNVSSKNISSLDGINYFSNLTNLNCRLNQLSTLDLTSLINLNELNCSNNQLTNLDISMLNNLTIMDCSYNPLGSLNVLGLTSLNELSCRVNQLSTLDLTGLTSLNQLDCYNNQLTTLDVSGLTNLNYLGCDYNQLTTLDLSGMTSLNALNCNNNQISFLNLSGLVNLSFLSCSNNQISNLDVLALTNLGHLSCDHNQLTTLDITSLTNLINLNCSDNQISSLDVLGLTNLIYLNCSFNQLTTLDLTDLTNLEDLTCYNNQLATLNLSGLTSLYNLRCQSNQLTTLDLSDLTNLSAAVCSDNQLATLDLSNLTNLYAFYCSDNQLTSLFIKNGRNELLSVSNNPNLAFICCDVAQIQDIQNVVDTSGLSNCAISSLCSFTPGGTFSTIQGSTTFDFNNNGCDALDSSYYQFTINITDSVNTGSLISDNNGNFVFPAQAGNYTFTPILPNPNYFTITPSTVQMTIPDTSNNTLPPFCITSNGIHHDLEVTILPTTPARPGFDATYNLVYKNNGNQVESGSVSFSFDDVLLDFLNASTAPNTTSTGVLTWNFSNLLPFQSEAISLTFNCNTPTETPPLNAGDTLYFTSTITGGQADETPLDNTFDLAQVVVGSYDPNDKTCLEGDIITPEMVGDYVHYMIRFENTGTYAAENVAVLDVIDVSRFDISSLQITASSHSMKTRISNGNEVEFIFENINLPFDDANNDGYVAFKIKTLSTLQLNDTLKNQANIYFDYNAPITTNEAQTVVQYPNSSVSLGLNSNSTTLNLFPNPAETTLYIPADVQITQADIFDMKGALVRSVSVRNNQIEVQGLSSGTYFTRLYSDAKLYSAKFMVK